MSASSTTPRTHDNINASSSNRRNSIDESSLAQWRLNNAQRTKPETSTNAAPLTPRTQTSYERACMYVCMCVCIYVCVSVSVSVCVCMHPTFQMKVSSHAAPLSLFVCVYVIYDCILCVCMQDCTDVYMHVHTHKRMDTYGYMPTYMHTLLFVQVSRTLSLALSTHTFTHIHIYIYTHIQEGKPHLPPATANHRTVVVKLPTGAPNRRMVLVKHCLHREEDRQRPMNVIKRR